MCRQMLQRGKFPASQIHHAADTTRNLCLRCTDCHTCQGCGLKKSADAFDANTKQCRSCLRKVQAWRCDACSQDHNAAAFDKLVLDNAAKHDRRRVCSSCFALGFTPRDVSRYKCAECGDKGHMKFDRSVLKNYKREDRHVALVCSDCVDRHRKVESTLRQKESIRCTCKGREHNASNDKCGLFPRYAGERRWPGSNMDVSFDDFHFCERMRKRKRT